MNCVREIGLGLGIASRRIHGCNRSFSSLLAAILVCLFCAAPSVFAQQAKPNEYQVKAAYLYNFGRFVKWPAVAANNTGAFTVCVLGQDPFGPALDSTLSGEDIDGKSVAVRRISKPQDAADCRILFISSKEESHLKEILTALDSQNVLTVSDMPDFSRRGGMIQFVSDDGKIRFEVNLSSAENAKLSLSSELLKVATTVKRNKPGDS